MRIAVGIVVYNQIVDETNTFTSLCKNNCKSNIKKTFFVLDNSEDDVVKKKNRHTCENARDFIYIDLKGNKGIAKAYNMLLETIDLDCYDWIMTCDQDTNFESGFFDIVSKNESGDMMVLAPLVFNSSGQMSPFKSAFDRSTYYINSGLLYPTALFNDKLKFNEKLFLDYVDVDMINQLQKKGVSIKVIKANLFQDFSGTSKVSIDSAKMRFKIFLNDTREYCRAWPEKKIAATYALLKRALRLTCTYRDVMFVRLLFEQTNQNIVKR